MGCNRTDVDTGKPGGPSDSADESGIQADSGDTDTDVDTDTDTDTAPLPCAERSPADWLGCSASGGLSEGHSGEVDAESVVPLTILHACDDANCAWVLSALCELHFPDRPGETYWGDLRYYPNGVAGSGLAEIGWSHDGERSCLLAVEGSAGRMDIALVPAGAADADAEAGGYRTSCDGGGAYEAEGWFTVE